MAEGESSVKVLCFVWLWGQDKHYMSKSIQNTNKTSNSFSLWYCFLLLFFFFYYLVLPFFLTWLFSQNSEKSQNSGEKKKKKKARLKHFFPQWLQSPSVPILVVWSRPLYIQSMVQTSCFQRLRGQTVVLPSAVPPPALSTVSESNFNHKVKHISHNYKSHQLF